MRPEFEIRADYDPASVVVYQAYARAIAEPAVRAQRFVPPFSFGRMTWIKPSFLWLMHRSNWAQKSGQECILAVRITRESFSKVLSLGVLTGFDARVHRDPDEWSSAMAAAKVHVQWDPERSLRGAALPHRSIQIGIGRDLIREFAEQWVQSITDLTPLTTKIRNLLRTGKAADATKHLPPERPWPIPPGTGTQLLLSPPK